MLRLSYDNATVTIDLQRTYSLSHILGKIQGCKQNILRRMQGCKQNDLRLSTIYLQNRKIVWDSVSELAYDTPKINFGTL